MRIRFVGFLDLICCHLKSECRAGIMVHKFMFLLLSLVIFGCGGDGTNENLADGSRGDTGDSGGFDVGVVEDSGTQPHVSLRVVATSTTVTDLKAPLDFAVDALGRVIDIKTVRAGRWYGFTIIEEGELVEQFACDADYVTVLDSMVLVDIPLREVDTIHELSCTTVSGGLVFRFHAAAFDYGPVSSWREADGYVAFEKPAISGDGTKIAWVIQGNADQVLVSSQDGFVQVGSSNAQGRAGNMAARSPSLSADGRYLTFMSEATNLVVDDEEDSEPAKRAWHVYLKDLQTGEIQRITPLKREDQVAVNHSAGSISGNGRYVFFSSNAPVSESVENPFNRVRFYRRDVQTGETVLVSQPYDSSAAVIISAYDVSFDGRYVVLASRSRFIGHEHDPSKDDQIYYQDIETGELLLASQSEGGIVTNNMNGAPSISADGRFVVFASKGISLMQNQQSGDLPIYRRDMQTGQLVAIPASREMAATNRRDFHPTISQDGRYIVFVYTFAKFGTLATDLSYYRIDMETRNLTQIVSVLSGIRYSSSLTKFAPTVSADGMRIAINGAGESVLHMMDPKRVIAMFDLFSNQAVDVSDIRGSANVNTLSTGTMSSLSADGRTVVFQTHSSDLVYGTGMYRKIRIYKKSLENGQMSLVSVRADGNEANADSTHAKITTNGRYVYFQSAATNLTSDRAVGRIHIFRKDLETGEVQLASSDSQGVVANGDSAGLSVSADGRYVVFQSKATNLIHAAVSGNRTQIYRKDMETGETVIVDESSAGRLPDGASSEPVISANGRYVAFVSDATNLIMSPEPLLRRKRIYRRDMQTGEVLDASEIAGADYLKASMSALALSADGRYIVFRSDAKNLVGIAELSGSHLYRRDLETGEIVLVDQTSDNVISDSGGSSRTASISADGRYIAFESTASNLLVSNPLFDVHVYCKDLKTGALYLLSDFANEASGNRLNTYPVISADGRYISFEYTGQVYLRRVSEN